jgi:hypothetical protein
MNEVKIEGQNYYFIARRADRPWGHAIDVSVFNYQNAVLGNISFCCHPEHSDFELYQTYETSKLVQVASELIAQGIRAGSFNVAWESGLTLTLSLNGSNCELSNIKA